ncbi:MAG: ATP-binding protein, partial [Candidatus Thermoplasmatota archaeon]|nr:ATP-binding protein [Candidatus Thermoplasmatota archaeon]
MNKPPRIKQLDNETIGHIAAGEVVERPAQVVKELLENSLDAQANQVDVIIERGGFDLIAIADNGVGISEDDIALSVDRHATSKLNSLDDLNEIYTMGFRGEALAS